MATKLKIRMSQWENQLIFKVHYMDPRFRRMKHEDKPSIFTASNGYKVISKNRPSISEGPKRIYLQGTGSAEDDSISILYCKNEKEASTIRSEILKALEDWAKNWEGWKKEKQPKDVNKYPYDYEF